MRSVVVLGSTGSIGENALAVAEALPEAVRIVGLATCGKAALVVEQAKRFGARVVAVADAAAAREAERLAAPHGIEVWAGAEGVEALAALPEADTVICALVGLAGLRPTLAAIDAGYDVALATKEVLVSAGKLVMRRCAEKGVNLLPLDSEHSALFQCLQGQGAEVACVRRNRAGEQCGAAAERVRRLVLTASGGPFALRPEVDFTLVKPEQALAHPRWKMGRKVTVDSATMMNKGLELLEARWLFDIPVDKISVVVHPESIVHSLVTFVDGSTLAQLSVPDMRVPIQYAMTWPERMPSTVPALDLAQQGSLTFYEPDERRFPCLGLIREAARHGGTMPAVLNAADEVAVEAFLDGVIAFDGIWHTVEKVMAAHKVRPCDSFATVFEVDAWARQLARELCAG